MFHGLPAQIRTLALRVIFTITIKIDQRRIRNIEVPINENFDSMELGDAELIDSPLHGMGTAPLARGERLACSSFPLWRAGGRDLLSGRRNTRWDEPSQAEPSRAASHAKVAPEEDEQEAPPHLPRHHRGGLGSRGAVAEPDPEPSLDDSGYPQLGGEEWNTLRRLRPDPWRAPDDGRLFAPDRQRAGGHHGPGAREGCGRAFVR